MDFAALDRGIALFNRRRYFEAHEVWETAWLGSSGQEKLFLQFLIQTAAALLHADRGNAGGASSVWNKALEKLALLPDELAGIDLRDFVTAMNEEFKRRPWEAREAPTLRRKSV